MATGFTSQDVAEWMWQQIQERGELYQVEAVEHIRANFGEQFISNGTGVKRYVRDLMNGLAGGRVEFCNDEALEDRYWYLKKD